MCMEIFLLDVHEVVFSQSCDHIWSNHFVDFPYFANGIDFACLKAINFSSTDDL